jgi:hypothetical protein
MSEMDIVDPYHSLSASCMPLLPPEADLLVFNDGRSWVTRDTIFGKGWMTETMAYDGMIVQGESVSQVSFTPIPYLACLLDGPNLLFCHIRFCTDSLY